MSYARLQIKLLNARDQREEALNRVLKSTRETIVFASTSIPGPDKCPSGSDLLFNWLQRMIRGTSGSVCWHLPLTCDVLGHHAIFSVVSDPEDTKQACVGIEASRPVTRLIDLDVYEQDGSRIGREEIGLAARRCFLCNYEATECIRLCRHDLDALNEHITRLLNDFSCSRLLAGTC